MLLPRLEKVKTDIHTVTEFLGLNRRDVIGENEFSDMQNMTSSHHPALSPRDGRGIGPHIARPNGIFSKGCLYWADGTGFYGKDGDGGAATLRGSVEDGPKQFASMGSLILIWPDKKYYDTKTKLFGSLEKRWDAGTQAVTYGMALWDGVTKSITDFTQDYAVSDTAPADPGDGAFWLDTSAAPGVLKRWSAPSKAWITVKNTYVKITANGIGVGLGRGDGVIIEGSLYAYYNGLFCLTDAADNYIVIGGVAEQTFSQVGGLTVKRVVPDMDFITECDNRLWGCSSQDRKIYACRTGSPFNWNCFEGSPTDSFSVAVSSGGDFTGAYTYAGYPLFFKETGVYKVSGSKPSNYQINQIAARGLQKGSHKSLAVVCDTLYYKSGDGVVAFDGGLPENISSSLGGEKFGDAAGGALGDKYYISMKDKDGLWHLFVYDGTRRLWHREDDTHALGFAGLSGALYFVNAADNRLYSARGTDEGAVEWYAQSGDWGQDTPNNKYLSKILIRMETESDAEISIYLCYDSDGQWERVFSSAPQTKKLFILPIIPRRCDHFRIKFRGRGKCKIYSVSKVLEQGSEL